MKITTAAVLLATLWFSGVGYSTAQPTAMWVDSYVPEIVEQVEQQRIVHRYTVNDYPAGQSIRLDPLMSNASNLRKQAVAVVKKNPRSPLKVGLERNVEQTASSLELAKQLQWQPTDNGGVATSIQLTSPEARGTRLTLTVEQLHAAARLSFISVQTGEVIEVTGEQIIDNLTANGASGRDYVTPYVDGDTVVLVIELPQGVTPSETQLAIKVLSHIYIAPTEAETVIHTSVDLSCTVNSVCDPSFDRYSRGVAAMIFSKTGGTYACTGTLLNDTETTFTPNFITANHCIDRASEATSLETFWFYKTTSCYSDVTSSGRVRVSGGADLLFTSAETDTTLLRLKGKLPAGVSYIGWTTQAVTKGTRITALNHPDFQPQRITQGSVHGHAKCTSIGGGQSSCSINDNASGDYLVTRNHRGIVSSGSSGSSMLVGHQGEYYVTGVLSGSSQKSCSDPAGIDVYGRFDYSFSRGLGKWLDKTPSPTLPAAPGEKTAIYRLYHTVKGTHFFTASAAERDSVVAKYPAYVSEGAAFFTYPKKGGELSPVYRFFNSKTGAHFYTISVAEKDSIQVKRPNFIYEGVAWYASAKPQPGAKPLYRFFSQKTGTHFYTTSAQEKDNIIAKYPSFIYEGQAYYVWTKQ